MVKSWPKIDNGHRALAVALFVFAAAVSSAHAQFGGTAIAETLTISSGTPVSGDLIAYDPHSQRYYIASEPNDPSLFGVVVTKPLLVLRGTSGGVPVVTSGTAEVNVTNAGGSIEVGDYLTSSSIPGSAQKAGPTDPYVIGTALQSFMGATSTGSGSILVALSFARRPQFSPATASSSPISSTQQNTPKTQGPTVPAVQVLRYLLAAFIAVGSVYAAFRNFGANITSGIVSIGRNPLAKTSIQLMVALNAALIVFISLLGLFVALVVVLMPL